MFHYEKCALVSVMSPRASNRMQLFTHHKNVVDLAGFMPHIWDSEIVVNNETFALEFRYMVTLTR